MSEKLLYLFCFVFKLLLEAPDDILCFKFNPSDPNIICAGCINGQVRKYLLSLLAYI